MTLEDLPSWAAELLRYERVARLAYLDGRGRPRVLPVTFGLAEGRVWSAIDEKPKRSPEPARVRAVRARPEAALCVDHYSDDWSNLCWVQLLGRVEIAAVAERTAAVEALAAKYPQYSERTPPGPLLGLSVERALSWRAAD